jgi:formylglycine-generating enzyme required for sulfatase activity
VRRLALAVAVLGATACGSFGPGRTSDVLIENVAVEPSAGAGQSARIVFDIAWDASFRDEINHDGVWLFAKVREPGEPWRHALLSSEPSAHRIGANNGVLATIEPAADGLGAFLYRTDDGFSAIDWDGVSLAADAAATVLTPQAEVEVVALPMVYVPEGPYLLGDGTSVAALFAGQFSAGTSSAPFGVDDEGAIVLGGGGEGSLGNHDRRVPSATPQQYWDDFSDTAQQDLPAAFPEGFAAFWVMRHELSQGDYARFLSMLDTAQQMTRNPALSIPAGEAHRYAIAPQAPYAVRPYNRAANWLSWMDLAAYADWSGLRPMTELEYEKASRGDRVPDAGEFAWGPEAPPAGKYNLQDAGTPQELVTNQAAGANVAFDGTIGLASSIAGPLRVGAFQPLATSRLGFGGSYYRITELSGNVAEMVVTVGRSTGRRYRGVDGDGALSSAGNAGGPEVEFWPGARRAAAGGYEVLNADGSGTRGGDWASDARALRVSDREQVNKPADHRDMRWGGRLVRSARK